MQSENQLKIDTECLNRSRSADDGLLYRIHEGIETPIISEHLLIALSPTESKEENISEYFSLQDNDMEEERKTLKKSEGMNNLLEQEKEDT